MPSAPTSRISRGKSAPRKTSSSSAGAAKKLAAAQSVTVTTRIPLELEAEVRRLAARAQIPAATWLREAIVSEVARRTHTIPEREFDLNDLAQMVKAQANLINDMNVRDHENREILHSIALALGVKL